MRWFERPSIDYSQQREARAVQIRSQLEMVEAQDAAERWRRVSREILTPQDPFGLHRDLFRENYRDWDEHRGPPPAVMPAADVVANANVTHWMRELGFDNYADLHRFSATKAEAFTQFACEHLNIRFRKAPRRYCDLTDGETRPRWFDGAALNISDSLLQGNLDRAAVLFQPADGAAIECWTLRQLWALSGRVANGLTSLGLSAGVPAAIDMPMTAKAIAIYIGIIRAGLNVVSIADSFAAEEIATRFRIANPQVVFTQDVVLRGGKQLPLYERVLNAGSPPAVVVRLARSAVALRAGDCDFDSFLGSEDFQTVERAPDDAINILFSSGTTGTPKAIPWDHTTPVRCALDGFVHQDIHEGDVVAWPTNLGWMMGPWLIFATLINRGTIAVHEGPPQTRAFTEFVEKAGVNVLGVVPSLVRAWRNSDCLSGVDWRGIKLFTSTGESSSPEDMLYLMSAAGYKPVIEYCGGTEVGGAYFSSTVLEPNSPSCFSAKTLGLDSIIVDDEGRTAETGEIYLISPAIGLSRKLLNADHDEVYFKDCPSGPSGLVLRRHGDEVRALPGGYFKALGRADDTMNLGGIKVSSVELERTMNQTVGLVETAAVAISPPEGGPGELVVYAVSEPGKWPDADALRARLQEEIRKHVNPLFKISRVVQVPALPRTASNKVIRRQLRLPI